jgi:hypothetical protein
MMRRYLSQLTLVLVVATIVGVMRVKAAPQQISAVAATNRPELNPRFQTSYEKIPLYFEANQGQADAEAKFLARGDGYTLFLTATQAVFALEQQGERGKREKEEKGKEIRSATALRMRLIGSTSESRVTGLEQLPGKANYFVGKDAAQWRTNIPTYAKVKYEQVYPGIDLVYYGNQQQLEYDFIVAPGADPRAIRLAFVEATGRSPLRVDEQGDLVVQTAAGDVRFHRPHLYQEVDGIKKEIDGRYILHESASSEPSPQSLTPNPQVGFEVAAYDTTKPLVSDPVLSYATVLKSAFFQGLAQDPEGSLYVTGATSSPDNFPTTDGALRSGVYWNVVVLKFSPTGAVLYSAYFGGSDVDVGQDIAVDATGNAYITGYTYSGDFPVSENAPQKNCLREDAEEVGCGEAFVVKLNVAASSVLYATYLGGSGGEEGNSIAIDSIGNAYVTGTTSSNDFPTTSDVFQSRVRCENVPNTAWPCDLFVVKLNASGSAFSYSSYLGGSNAEFGGSVAVDSIGNAYITGTTFSTDFPTTSQAFQATGGSGQAFVVKLDPSGSTVIYSTYLGGSGEDSGDDITVDQGGNAYVTGATYSIDFPVTKDAFQKSCDHSQADGFCSYEIFVAKLNPMGSALIYSTYIGGSGYESGNSIALNTDEEAYITGFTTSDDFPIMGAFQNGRGGGTCGPLRASGPCADAFITKIARTGQMQHSTYLGGYGSDNGLAIVVGNMGEAYILAASTGRDFPGIDSTMGDSTGTKYFLVTVKDQLPSIQGYLEYPDNGPVAGIGVIHGWAFATETGVRISRVDLFIDGQRVKDIPGILLDEIPCCSERQDVRDAFPRFPAENTLNSGWGITFNWSLLDAGNHSVRIKATSTTGEIFLTDTRTVSVVKPADSEFLDQFALSQATVSIQDQDLVVNGVVVRDKATQQQKTINTRYRWAIGTQSFNLTHAETVATSSTQWAVPSPSAWVAMLAGRLPGWPGLASAQAALALVPYFEDPTPEQIVSGVGLVRGWAFPADPMARITAIWLAADTDPRGTIPCCSGRGDVATAFLGQVNALDSGWGAVFNYGTLSSGLHTITVQIEDSTGAAVALAHNVMVVRLGGFEFIDQLELSETTARINGQEIEIQRVKIRDKATQQEKTVDVRLRWFEGMQGLGIVAANE